MIFARRVVVLVLAAVLLLSFFQLRISHGQQESVPVSDATRENDAARPGMNSVPKKPAANINGTIQSPFTSKGELKPLGQAYTRGLVIGRLSRENTTWLDDYLAAMPDPSLRPYLYVVDNDAAPLHTPMNKGNEAMVYLTYIVDNYDDLPDITIFMHPHQKAWHTPELLNHDAVEILKRLNTARVIREGYMNLRCYWDPGCPRRVYSPEESREEFAVHAAWDELFPGEPMPEVLAAPCCAQFAVAKHRIRAIPREHFHRYRNWLIQTPETDWTSGRVLEYLWQKIFTGQAEWCPDARTCYCDAYSICFSTPQEFEDWFDNHRWWRQAMTDLENWNAQAAVINTLGNWKDIEQMAVNIPPAARNIELQLEMDTRFERLTSKRFEAIRNGDDPNIRRLVTGR